MHQQHSSTSSSGATGSGWYPLRLNVGPWRQFLPWFQVYISFAKPFAFSHPPMGPTANRAWNGLNRCWAILLYYGTCSLAVNRGQGWNFPLKPSAVFPICLGRAANSFQHIS
jgi:hypothetical protein